MSQGETRGREGAGHARHGCAGISRARITMVPVEEGVEKKRGMLLGKRQ
jgi:hypothetical protein